MLKSIDVQNGTNFVTPTKRQFIKTVAVMTGYSAICGDPWSKLFAGEIAPHSASNTGTLRVRVKDFPALASDLGSIRLGINPINGNVGPSGTFYPVIINRAPNNVFHAISSRCTHQACVVEAMDSSSQRMVCLCHGSVFGIDGRRISGQATSALTKYAVKFDGTDLLEITIAGLGYSLTATPVEGGAGGTPRLQLGFRSFRNVTYEVKFREHIDKESTPVAFATSATGAVDNMEFTATSATNQTLFVERVSASGFYSVSIKPTEV